MQTVNLGRTGLKVTRICFGCMSYGTKPWQEWVLGEEAARGMGMFLIQALVDEAEWVSSPPSGSYARMVIHLRRANPTIQ